MGQGHPLNLNNTVSQASTFFSLQPLLTEITYASDFSIWKLQEFKQGHLRWKYNTFCELILEVPHNFFCYSLLFLRRKALGPALTQWEDLFFFFNKLLNLKKYIFIWLPWTLVGLWSIFCCSCNKNCSCKFFVQMQVVVPGLRSFNAYLFRGMRNPTSPVRDWTLVTCTARWILFFFFLEFY